MDIKLKKSKKVIGFTAWLAGCTLVITCLLQFVSESVLYGNTGLRIKEAVNGDYQNTAEFADCLSDYMNTFLSMSVDGPLFHYYYNDYYGAAYEETYTGSGEEEAVDVAEAAVEISETAVAETSFGMEETTERENPSAYYFSYTTGEKDRETNRRDAEAYNRQLQNDRNILYRIERAGEVLYTNEESLRMYGDPEFTMPEGGYNFVMYFDGERVGIVKDGREISPYGDDGYYREDSDWYVPGYKNFPVDSSIQDTSVCIAVAQTPGITVYKDYSGQEESYYSNVLYGIKERLDMDGVRYGRQLNMLAAGAILLVISFFFRKEKKEADRDIAGVTGRAWYEVKLLFLFGIIYCIFMSFIFLSVQSGFGWSNNYDFSYYGEVAAQETMFYGGEADGRRMLSLAVIFGFPVLWLFFNDVRHNRKPWRKSLTAGILRLFRTSLLKLPSGKRLVRRQMWTTVAVLITAAVPTAFLSMMCYSFFSYEEFVAVTAAACGCILILLLCQLLQAKAMKKTATDLDLLVGQIETVHEGKLTEPVEIDESSDLYESVCNLNEIRQGMRLALEEQMKSERMKVELIANVSHDIRTPLTSIISYVELLKQEELPAHVKEYVSILDSKSQRLKTMVQDVFEVSKAASGELPVRMEDLDLGKLLRQTLADMSEQILSADVTLKTEIPEEAVFIHADGERLYRVFQNLIQNALKYSLDGSRIFITLQHDGELALASVKNTSREELPEDTDFTGRFTRGDRSRSDGGSGLGLSIARSFTEACGGVFKVETIADLFIVTLSFAKVNQTALPPDNTETPLSPQ